MKITERIRSLWKGEERPQEDPEAPSEEERAAYTEARLRVLRSIQREGVFWPGEGNGW